MNYKLNESKLFNFRSLRFKSWLYYFTMTLLILGILLVIQTAFFSIYYSTMKAQDVERIGENVIKKYTIDFRDNQIFKKFVYDTNDTSGADIAIFKGTYKIEDGKITEKSPMKDLLTSEAYIDDIATPQGTIRIDDNFFILVESGKTKFNYVTNLEPGSYVAFGAKVEDPIDGIVYIRVSSPLSQSEFITGVMLRQSAISTAICAVLSFGLSLLLSNLIAKPVSQFSRTARKLAGGDFNVKFKSEGFSEIEDLADMLNFATEEMGKTDQLRRDLLANVSHDLRTPLTMVKAYAEMIRDLSGDDPKKRLNHCQTIIDEADRLTNLVNDIQNLSKLQSKTETLDYDEVDLSYLTKLVMQRFDIFSQKEGYILRQEIDSNCLIFADENKIEQVLYNLIGNAINYTGDDKTVTVYVRNLTGKIYFGVRDSGKGIAKEEIDSVWERYYRASQSKRKRVGTGLGLSIVKSILIMHNAEYGIQSAVGEGTTFWFCLPQFYPFEDAEAIEQKPEKQKKIVPVKEKKVKEKQKNKDFFDI